MLNHLELVAQRLGFELVIEQRDGFWIITENIFDCYAFELPVNIGDTEAKSEAWLVELLSEKAGV